MELLINLGENFGIDYENCKLILNCKNLKTDEQVYTKILNNIYLNKKHIKNNIRNNI